MKTTVSTSPILLALVSLLLCLGCQHQGQTPDSTTGGKLAVLKTTTSDVHYTGGEAIVELSTAGVNVKVSDTWLHPQLKGNTLTLVADPNPSYESRTALVHLSLGDEKQHLPITQLGRISIVDVQSFQFSFKGQTQGFVWNTVEEPTIQGLDSSWLSYELRSDSIFFTAQPLPEGTDSRSCDLTISAGPLLSSSVTFSQVAPPLSYENVLGKYTLKYLTLNSFSEKSFPVQLVPGVQGKSFLLKGFPIDLVVLFDEASSSLSITVQSGMRGETKIDLVALDSKDIAFKDDPTLGVVGKWNKDKEDIMFLFENNGVTLPDWVTPQGKPHIVNGFVFFGPKGLYRKKGVPSNFVDFRLEKTPTE